MILLYYPQNTQPNFGRMPLSLMALTAQFGGEYQYKIIDGNVDRNAIQTILSFLHERSDIDIIGVSVMPGTQMYNAIIHCKEIKKSFPDVKIIWGGYFPSMHTESVLNSDCVDFVLRNQSEKSFIELNDSIKNNKSYDVVHNLSYRANGKIIHNPSYPIFDPNDRAIFRYEDVNMDDYALRTFIGTRTFSHESSAGCPHKCNFCGVVDVFQSRWKAETPERTFEVLNLLNKKYGMDGIEFHDSDFFVSEKRVYALCEKMIDLKIQWWAEGRIDTLLNYDVQTWKLMERSGLKMIFFGAESGLDETLMLMDKKGVTREKTKAIASLCKKYYVQSEFSFVMGSHPTKTKEDIDATIDLMYELESINPKSQMHPFIYTPVPFGNIYDVAVEGGLRYPKKLNDWISEEWTQYSLRNNPHTPWLTKRLHKKIINFRAVHQSYFPKTNDRFVARWKISLLKLFSTWRYKFRIFSGAYELRLLLRFFINPSIKSEGF